MFEPDAATLFAGSWSASAGGISVTKSTLAKSTPVSARNDLGTTTDLGIFAPPLEAGSARTDPQEGEIPDLFP